MSRLVGVCSWSLQPESPADLAEKVSATGCRAVQLALDPLRRGEWDETETFGRLSDAGITVPSGMMAMDGEDYSTIESISRTGGVRPDMTWLTNRKAASELAGIAERNGIGLVTFHAGFLPRDPQSEERKRMIGRLREIASVYADAGVGAGLETGQEDAGTLLDVLAELDCPNVGVNFDPANILLYGVGDPAESLIKLAAHVVQIHIKDAVASPEVGRWGREVRVGDGQVDWESFFDITERHLSETDMMVERESGDDRVADISGARIFVEEQLNMREMA